jgi:DNA-directed RNA polymerase subunit beta
MGSNMQRQARAALIRSEPPVVATGMETLRGVELRPGRDAPRNAGVGDTSVSATEIAVGDDVYALRKFTGLNERTLPKPASDREGTATRSRRGQVIADGAATKQGELSLGQERLRRLHDVGRLQLRRRDARVSEELIRNDVFTSIHIEDYEATHRGTEASASEEFTRDIPNVSEQILTQPRRRRHRSRRHPRRPRRHPRRQGRAEVRRTSSRPKRSCSTRSSVAPAKT